MGGGGAEKMRQVERNKKWERGKEERNEARR